MPARARKSPEAVIAKACAVQQYGQNALIIKACILMNQIPAPITPNAQSVSVFNERMCFLLLGKRLLCFTPNVFTM